MFNCIYLLLLLFSQSCPTLCHPVDCSTQDCLLFTISGSLLKLITNESVMPTNHLILCHPLLLLLSVFPSNSIFPNESVLCIRWPEYWSFSFSIIPVNIQDWFPLGWYGWISLQSKGLSRVFSKTTAQKHQFFSTQPFLYGLILISINDYWKNHSFDYTDLCWQSDVSAF